MRKFILFTFVLSLLMLCGCSKDDEVKATPYNLQASALKPVAGDKTVVVSDLAGYRDLFADEMAIDKYDIDFSKKNLIVSQGISNYGIASINSSIENIDGIWILSVEIQQNLTTAIEPWCVGYTVPKSSGTKVLPNIIYESGTKN